MLSVTTKLSITLHNLIVITLFSLGVGSGLSRIGEHFNMNIFSSPIWADIFMTIACLAAVIVDYILIIRRNKNENK